MSTLLDVERLRVAFRDRLTRAETVAVQDVSFRLERGERLGIVGESGSGKSTLARALLGHVRPGGAIAAGSIRLDGIELAGAPAALLASLRGRRVALVPQNPLRSLTPHRPILLQLGDALARHRGLSGQALHDAALGLLAELQVAEPHAVLRRYPHELSGGQRQRVVIAAAMAGEPDLLVLDEPTTALDKSTEAQVIALIRALQARTGCALVVVSHDLRAIDALCGRVLVMRHGSVVEAGDTAQVLHRPRSAYARELVASLPRLEAPLARPAVRGSALLEIEGMGFRYRPPGIAWPGTAPARPVLEDVSLSIQPGRTLGLVGESGSGKSTLGALVAGLLAGHEGTMRFAGLPLEGAARHRERSLRRRIQIVFQDPAASLNPSHRVLDLVARAFQGHHGLGRRAARDRAAASLDRIGIGAALLGRIPAELSGGQQQRVAIARAFAAEPELVVCDEITSALDVTVQAQVLDVMRELQERHGTAYLFISHDLAVVAQMADTVAVLHRGRVVAEGPTARILEAPEDAYTLALVGAFARRAEAVPA